MVIGIVGSEEIKFTREGKAAAQKIIRDVLSRTEVREVVSGGCHLGGIDSWTIEIGKELGRKTTEFLPKKRSWEGGYKERNLQIASTSNEVHCITVDVLPMDFSGMRFDFCYHCATNSHVKSGGCWTMKQAIRKGKKGILHVVRNLEEVKS